MRENDDSEHERTMHTLYSLIHNARLLLFGKEVVHELHVVSGNTSFFSTSDCRVVVILGWHAINKYLC